MKNLPKIVLGSILIITIIIGLIYSREIIYAYKLDRYYADAKPAEGINDKVVLVNIGDGDRSYLAKVIKSIAACDPAVIGMDFTLFKLKERKSDSLIRSAMASTKTVISSTPNKAGNGYVDSHWYFTDVAYGEGVAALITDYNIATSYYPIYKYGDIAKQHISLPIAMAYDSTLTMQYISQITPGEKYVLPLSWDESNFIKYDFNDTLFDCEALKNKVVMMGYLGPKEEDIIRTLLYGMQTEDGEYDPDVGKMYGVVLVTNQVLGILEGVPPKKF